MNPTDQPYLSGAWPIMKGILWWNARTAAQAMDVFVTESARPRAAIEARLRQDRVDKLLGCLAQFVSQQCSHLAQLNFSEVIDWVASVDRCLTLAKWQPHAFLEPTSLVVLYMLLKACFAVDPPRMGGMPVKTTVMSCLYIAYACFGSEISYPAKPFITGSDRRQFFACSLGIANKQSNNILKANTQPEF